MHSKVLTLKQRLIMAILNGIISKLNGSAGNLTFKYTGGQTIVSEKVTSTTDAKTDAQQRQRMKWPNVIRMYQVLQPYMKLAFGGSKDGRGDYQKFVSANMSFMQVYLTKQQVAAGACIVAPCQVTQGTLKSISVKGKGKEAVTDILLGSLAIDEETTVAQFSNAVVQNNRYFSYGDQITYFLLTQDMNDVTNTPIADVDACYIVLDKNNNAKLLSLVDPRGFAVKDGKLAADASAEYGNHGMVWIHSRKEKGKTLLSTQYLICQNILLVTFQSNSAYDLAVASYGGVKDVYLTPGGMIEPENAEDSPAENPSETPSQTPGQNQGSGTDTPGGQTPSGGGGTQQGGGSGDDEDDMGA